MSENKIENMMIEILDEVILSKNFNQMDQLASINNNCKYGVIDRILYMIETAKIRNPSDGAKYFDFIKKHKRSLETHQLIDIERRTNRLLSGRRRMCKKRTVLDFDADE